MATISEALAALRAATDRLEGAGKASKDDHFYGAWVGGDADEGGHPKDEHSKKVKPVSEGLAQRWTTREHQMCIECYRQGKRIKLVDAAK